ncbi:MAG: 30S ribosomal protein S4 [Brevinematales bacterium]|nr:30S ribosomal protein S4 [Brevinematales bacterium]
MGRYTGPLCKLCRREGIRLFLKGDKCVSQACTLNKKSYPPGKVSKFAKKPTEYALQLREKQKVKRYYGVYERQFRKFFAMASKHKGVTGEMLLQYLERRLDNIVYRAGFVSSRRAARQLVSHGTVYVNGKRVTIPSYILKAGDEIELAPKAKTFDFVVKSLEASVNKVIPGWLEVDNSNVKVKITSIPTRAEMNLDIEVNEQLIVELYSK